MNIYILNCPNTYNYGSMMMAENFIYYFEKTSNNKNTYFIETNDIKNTQNRLREATGINNIFGVCENALLKRKCDSFTNRKSKNILTQQFIKLNYIKYILCNWSLSKIQSKNIMSEIATTIDKIIVLGGDDFTEDYGVPNLLLHLIKINTILNSHIPVYMIGQTMGDFRYYRKNIVKKMLKNVKKIYARDDNTYNHLEYLNLNNINKIPDLALLPLAKETRIINNCEYILFCPSEIVWQYENSNSRSNCVDFYIDICKYLLKKYEDKKIVILSHVLKPKHADDRKMVRDVYKILQSTYQNRIIKVDIPLYPVDVRKYIKRSYMVVSGRMHPIISSIECNVPNISISYSKKYNGIVGDQYGLGNYILDVRYQSYEKLFEKFKVCCDKLDFNYEDIKLDIKRKNNVDQVSIINKIKDICERV